MPWRPPCLLPWPGPSGLMPMTPAEANNSLGLPILADSLPSPTPTVARWHGPQGWVEGAGCWCTCPIAGANHILGTFEVNSTGALTYDAQDCSWLPLTDPTSTCTLHPPLAGRATVPRSASEREENRPAWATQVTCWPRLVPLALDLKALARGASRAAATASQASPFTVHPTGRPQLCRGRRTVVRGWPLITTIRPSVKNWHIVSRRNLRSRNGI